MLQRRVAGVVQNDRVRGRCGGSRRRADVAAIDKVARDGEGDAEERRLAKLADLRRKEKDQKERDANKCPICDKDVRFFCACRDGDPDYERPLPDGWKKSGRGFKVVLADKECEYAETFRFYMTTKLGNPHFTPELCAQVAVINFTVTMQGLEQQLLGRVVKRERSELEEQRLKLVEEVNSNKKLLKFIPHLQMQSNCFNREKRVVKYL